MSSSTNWYYRLGTDGDNSFLWTGSIGSKVKITRDQAKHFIRTKERMQRLPARTIVMSQRELLKQRGHVTQDDTTTNALDLIKEFCWEEDKNKNDLLSEL